MNQAFILWKVDELSEPCSSLVTCGSSGGGGGGSGGGGGGHGHQSAHFLFLLRLFRGKSDILSPGRSTKSTSSARDTFTLRVPFCFFGACAHISSASMQSNKDGVFRTAMPGMSLAEARDRFLLSCSFRLDKPSVAEGDAQEEFVGIPACYRCPSARSKPFCLFPIPNAVPNQGSPHKLICVV